MGSHNFLKLWNVSFIVTPMSQQIKFRLTGYNSLIL
jgi:hypothetical protein